MSTYYFKKVSTHSRPKAAGSPSQGASFTLLSFNTQPPEGGWPCPRGTRARRKSFQHTAARRRLECNVPRLHGRTRFNTQPPEGGCALLSHVIASLTGFNTQPPEGGCGAASLVASQRFVSTHSRPKAAA